MMNKLSVWFAYGLGNSDSSFMVRVDLNKCNDYDDLRNQVMKRKKNYQLYKYVLMKNSKLKHGNQFEKDFYVNNSPDNPIRIVKTDREALKILKNEAEDLCKKDTCYLWCSLDGYTPTKIKVNNLLNNLEDVQNELHLKFNISNRDSDKCFINEKQIKLSTKLDGIIKNNSYTNPIVFKRSRNFLRRCVCKNFR
ncbi:unnamed protein product [Brachionus calyciflorus]|uniref:Uncharacterized protein n=1 Tax=Brachionus calyciflorus TaxID=104777 RepID=A0A814EPD1_9BILA|nr:unnamed protein product [Brachionus calyciflorus]